MKSEEEMRKALCEAPAPEPIGGYEAARERAMGRVRHRFPPSEKAVPKPGFLRPLAASLALAGVAFAVFFAWPERAAEADALPSEAQMNRFYDQHETHHAAHLQDEAREASR